MSTVDKEAEGLRSILGGGDEPRVGLTLGHRTGSRIRILHASTSATAAAKPLPSSERRRDQRLTPDQTRWGDAAKLRPGFDVRVLDIGPNGVLIEAPTRLHVGNNVELSLFTSDTTIRLDVMGVVRRCHVSSLSPLTYRGAVEFGQAIEVDVLEPFLFHGGDDGLTQHRLPRATSVAASWSRGVAEKFRRFPRGRRNRG